MRPFLATLVAVLILGGVGAYAFFVRTLPPLSAQSAELAAAPGEFSVDVTLTFDASADSFSLDPTSVLLRFEDHETRITEPIRAGQPTTVKIPNLRLGSNDIYVEVHAAEATLRGGEQDSADFSLDAGTDPAQVLVPARAVRLRVLRDGVAIHEKTLWSEPGQPIAGAVTLTLLPTTEDDAPPH